MRAIVAAGAMCASVCAFAAQADYEYGLRQVESALWDVQDDRLSHAELVKLAWDVRTASNQFDRLAEQGPSPVRSFARRLEGHAARLYARAAEDDRAAVARLTRDMIAEIGQMRELLDAL